MLDRPQRAGRRYRLVATVDDIQTVAEPSERSKLPAGIIDAGFASLATFVASLVAVVIFSDADRGIYAVYFTAFNLGAIIAYQLVYVPAEIESVARELPIRITIIDDSLRIGRLPAVIGALIILGATITTAPIADANLARWLKVRIGAPLLQVEYLIRDVEGNPVETPVIFYRSDLHAFTLRLTWSPDGPGGAEGWSLRGE